MIEHCGYNKHVRKRVSDKPDLMRHSRSVRETVCLAYLMNLPQNATIYLAYMSYLLVTTAMRNNLCDVKMRALTMMPVINPPDAPIMESYENNEKIIP